MGDGLVRVLGKLGIQGVDAGGERLERARDLTILRVGRQIQRHGALALQERQLDVVCKEKQLGWVGRRHCGCVAGVGRRRQRGIAGCGLGSAVWWDKEGDGREGWNVAVDSAGRRAPQAARCSGSRCAAPAVRPSEMRRAGPASPGFGGAARPCPQLQAPSPRPALVKFQQETRHIPRSCDPVTAAPHIMRRPRAKLTALL